MAAADTIKGGEQIKSCTTPDSVDLLLGERGVNYMFAVNGHGKSGEWWNLFKAHANKADPQDVEQVVVTQAEAVESKGREQ
ncbi:hypothetical protein J6590_042839 [Homalodisca vitripennis]|nr:hypothetical protein J6590_042839 [Homalodisca vitripennis]